VVPEEAAEEGPPDALLQQSSAAGTVSVSCGGTFSALLMVKSGQLYTWGLGLHGELGVGHLSSTHIG
jgi:alpha-tubulin suppressor-like RCC1 family protein